MSLDDGFRKMLAGVKLADEGRDEIMAGLEQAWDARKDLDQQLTDLREAVATLQTLVLEQGQALLEQSQTINKLRDELGGAT